MHSKRLSYLLLIYRPEGDERMSELTMLADTQRTVYPEEVTRQLHVMAQTRESLQVIDRRSNHRAVPPT